MIDRRFKKEFLKETFLRETIRESIHLIYTLPPPTPLKHDFLRLMKIN